MTGNAHGRDVNERRADYRSEGRSETEVKRLTERVAYLTNKLYGRQSEQVKQLPSVQDSGVFNSPEQIGHQSQEAAANQVRRPRKSKKMRGEILRSDLPVEEVVIDLSDKHCAHGHPLVLVTTKVVHEQLRFTPGHFELVRTLVKVYKCMQCRKEKHSNEFYQGPVDPSLLAHSIVSPSLMTDVIWKKYGEYLPLYRQVPELKTMGLDVSDTTLASWVIKAAELVRPLYDLIHQRVMAQPFLQGDETPIQVLTEEGKMPTSRSYMWVARTVKSSLERGVYYAYSATRSGTFALEMYAGFTGVLQCDGYAGYNLLDQITRVGCWAHARRKFYDAAKAAGHDGQLVMNEPLRLLNEMFELEGQWQHFSPRARRRRRHGKLRRLVQKFWRAVDHMTVLPKERLGKAVAYVQNQRDSLNRILDLGEIDWSNNASERNMKPVLMGRKNWFFSKAVDGAKANAIWLTLIESTKANGLDPRTYIEDILKRMSQLPTFAKPEQYESLLQWRWTMAKVSAPAAA